MPVTAFHHKVENGSPLHIFYLGENDRIWLIDNFADLVDSVHLYLIHNDKFALLLFGPTPKKRKDMTLNFFTLLSIISIFITLLLSLFFYINKKGNVLENRILAALLTVFNLQIFYSFATSSFDYMFFMNWHKMLFLLRQTSFLTGPLIFFYVNSLVMKKPLPGSKVFHHSIPFFLAVFVNGILLSNGKPFIIWKSVLDLYFTVLILTHNLIYIVLSVRCLRSGSSVVRDLFSGILKFRHSGWLPILLIGFIMIWIVNLNSFAIYMILRNPGWCAYTASIYALTVFLFINTIMFMILLKPDIYYRFTKNKSNGPRESEKAETLQRLNDYMENHKPYLNPEITLESLAGQINVNHRMLSQIINETYKKNFKTYILEYRIKESMEILANSNYGHLTVLEVLYRVGFSSKSAFNNQFKLFTKLTPLEYRSRAIAS